MKKKICFIVALAGTANSFLRDHIEALSRYYDVYLVGNIKDASEVSNLEIAGFKSINIVRNISIINDLKALLALKKYFNQMNFSAVHSVTPKAGLLTAIAGLLARIPIRIHIFTGQVWATRKGFFRMLLKSMDSLIAFLDTNILVDGKSQMKFLMDNGVIKRGKARVLAEGSICGVNTERFNPTKEIRLAYRKEIGVSDENVVFAFMGRINKEKGAYELLSAFNKLAVTCQDVYLLLIGYDESGLQSHFSDYPNIRPNENFLFYGSTKRPYEILQAGDVFVLPTYREGFGASVIEASCLGLPVITTDAYGVLDANVSGVTGLQCKVADVDSLFVAMKQLAEDKDLRLKLGANGRKRVLDHFSSDVVTSAWVDYYQSLVTVL